MEGHLGSVYALAVSPDGRSVYSGSDDNTVKQLDVSSGAVGAVVGHCGGVRDVVGDAAAGADTGRALGLGLRAGRVIRRSLCIFWQRRQNREAVERIKQGGAC